MRIMLVGTGNAFTLILFLNLMPQFPDNVAFMFEDKNESDERFSESIESAPWESCGCGSQQKHWFVYVMFEDKLTSSDSYKSLRICSGIIISPNVVMTSNRCLQLPGHTIQVYDTWQPVNGKGNIYRFSKISVSYTPGPTPLTFRVTDILFSQQFALSSSLGEFPQQDVLLLQVDTDLTKTVTPKLPICLMTPDKVEELINATFSTYEIIEYLQDEDDTSGKKCLESHTTANKIRFALFHTDAFSFTIRNMSLCHERFLQEDVKPPSPEDNLLCVEFIHITLKPEYQFLPNFSPLIVTTADGMEYLHGISTNLTVQLPTGEKLTYYTRIDEKMLKYIIGKLKGLDAKLCTGTDNNIAAVGETFLQSNVTSIWYDLDQVPANPLPFPKPNILDMSLNCECGAQNNERPEVRIVGGEEAIPYEFGWIVYLLMKSGDEYSQCTASLVADNIILTAAHCVADETTLKPVSPENVAVFLNAHNRTGDENQVAKYVESIVIHPGYIDPLNIDNLGLKRLYDVALLILKERFRFPKTTKFTDIHPVCLPNINDFASFPVNATLLGYGRTSFFQSQSAPDKLKKGNVTVVSFQQCSQLFNNEVPENYLCSFNFPNNYVIALNGDSGGLVMYKNDVGNWVHLGVTSTIGHVNATNENVSETDYCNVATIYMNTLRFMSFIEYVAGLANAKFCRTTMP